MKVTVLVLLAAASYIKCQTSFPASLENLFEEQWLSFKLTYNKTYTSRREETLRRDIFIENNRKIAKFNQESARGRYTFRQRLNSFGDLLQNEFQRTFNGFNAALIGRVALPRATTFIPNANVIFPDYIDWREHGAVTPVRQQEGCAACWSFAATGALESHTFRKTGRLTQLSPQNLIDCSKKYGTDGCIGGLMDPAYEYVRQNPGIDTEAAYPYEARDANCRFRPEAVGATCTGYVDIAQGDEKGLEAAVATIGPVSVAMDARSDFMQFAGEGIYSDPECRNSYDALNHAVLVIGFGTEPNGQKYWLIKNSYGSDWGNGGYFKLAKDANNHCGIATIASFPLV